MKTCGDCVRLDPTPICNNPSSGAIHFCKKRMTWERPETPRGEPGAFFCGAWRGENS